MQPSGTPVPVPPAAMLQALPDGGHRGESPSHRVTTHQDPNARPGTAPFPVTTRPIGMPNVTLLIAPSS